MQVNDILAIIICFHPDHRRLRDLISNISWNVSKIILFDNGGVNPAELIDVADKVKIESRGRNVGLGEALNFACDAGVRGGYRFVVSFDQDSSPPREMIDLLRRELLVYQDKDARAIAIGPQLIDRRNGHEEVMPFICFNGFKALKWSGEGTRPVSHLITSGCMIDVSCWGTVDRFLDDLFIDYVDNNWSWRAGRRGYVLLGTSLAKMPHELSEGIEQIGAFSTNKYSPLRRYFQMRNSAYHLFHERLTLAQRLYVLRSMAVTFVSAMISDPSSLRSLSQCIRGLGHGLVGRLGPWKKTHGD